MIVAAIFITDERKQSINFSDPYYEEAHEGLRPEEEHRGLRHAHRHRLGTAVPRPGSRRASTATSSTRSATCCCGTGSRPPCSSRSSRRSSARCWARSSATCAWRSARVLQRARAGVHRHHARHAGPGPADAHLLRRLRLGEHRSARGRDHRLRAEFRGLCRPRSSGPASRG